MQQLFVMRRILFLYLIVQLCMTTLVHSQVLDFITDQQGNPVLKTTAYNMDGSPYFSDYFSPADINCSNGKTYRDVSARINLLTKEVEYKTTGDSIFITVLHVKSIFFKSIPDRNDGPAFTATFTSVGEFVNDPGAAVYQVVEPGKIALAKKIDVTFHDHKLFGDASITRTFDWQENLYAILPGNQVKKMEKGKDFMLDLLSDKKQAVDDFIAKNSIRCKTEKDFRKVISYYNSL